jgi:DNA (cytosine-5)-methyltransferase 1
MSLKHRGERPWLLDLFCGAGGAGEGYRRAGFHVVGVDIAPQKHNPHEFYQDDALRVLDVLIAGEEWQGYRLHDFQVIHASPPCQNYSTISRNLGYASRHLGSVPRVRNALMRSGCAWIMENVPGAPMDAAIVLCGSSFGLGIPEIGWYLQRHRLFESNCWIWGSPCSHRGIAISVCGLGTPKPIRDKIGRTVKIGEYRQLMGINWMSHGELSQAISPAYTTYIGKQLRSALEQAA